MATKQAAGTKSRNGTRAAPAEAGLIRQQLDKPQKVGDLMHSEASEIKERRRLIEAKVSEVNDLAKVVSLLRNEQTAFLHQILQSRGLTLQDDYNIDSEAGVILRTATYVAPDVAVKDTKVIAATPVTGE